MTHQPKTLALLISLIGAGVAPAAYARADLGAVRLPLPEVGTTFEVPQPTALDLTRWSPGLMWREQEEGSVEFDVPIHAMRVALWGRSQDVREPVAPPSEVSTGRAPDEDRAASDDEGAGLVAQDARSDENAHPGPADAKADSVSRRESEAGASAPANEPKVVQGGVVAEDGSKVEQDRVAAADPHASVQGWSRHLRSLVQSLVPKAAPVPEANTETVARSVARVRFAAGATTTPPIVRTASPHVEQLMESLSAVLLDDVTNLSRDRVLARIAHRFPAAVARVDTAVVCEPAMRDRRTIEQRIARPEIVVLSQSGEVLRDLEGILSNHRQRVGAIAAEPAETIVHSRVEKVLETLNQVSATRDLREDGATRRLRKLEAARLRAAAAAAVASPEADSNTTTAGTVDKVDVDLSLPLAAKPVEAAAATPDAVAAEKTAAAVDHVDIDIGLPPAADSMAAVAAAASGSDSKVDASSVPAPAEALSATPVAIAMGTADAASKGVDIDIDLTQPLAGAASAPVASEALRTEALGAAQLSVASAIDPIVVPAAAATEVDIDLSVPLNAAGGAGSDEKVGAAGPAEALEPAPSALVPLVAETLTPTTAVTEVDLDLGGPMVEELVAGSESADDTPDERLATDSTDETSASSEPRFSPFGTQAMAMNSTALDRMRGGFVTDGLNISFGIERAVYINGALVTSTILNVSDLGKMTGGHGSTVLDSGTLALVQSGSGNVVANGSISPSSVGTVIQNTLDGQKIQNVTVINATVNSMAVLRGLNLQSSLRSAVISSLGR